VEFTVAGCASNATMKKKLQQLITDYKSDADNPGARRKRTLAEVSRPTTVTEVLCNQGHVLINAPDDSPGEERPSESQYGPKGTPPVEIRAGRYSALKTASCSQASISSVSCTLDSASVHTRQSAESAYDSDSVDGDDLDEEDNAYFELPEGMEVGESDDESEADAIDGTTARGNDTYSKYVSSLLWKFEAVEVCLLAIRSSRLEFPALSTSLSSVFRSVVGATTSSLHNYPKRNPHGLVWKDITTAKMYCFLGISPIDGGGYPAPYFRDKDMEVQYSRAQCSRHSITNTKGFAHEYMTVSHFKQFHPEDKDMVSGGRDKCYQL
jgi:hypothetical protein